jgi:hypothetical protein
VGLTARARSALERLGVHTLGELLGYEPSLLTRARGVPDATRKEILAQTRALRAQLPAVASVADEDRPLAHGVEALCATLLPERTSRNTKERAALEVLLGQAPGADGKYLRWPAQKDAAAATGQAQPQISVWLRKHAGRWLANQALSEVRGEIVALLDARGAVMSAVELAEALIAARGSFTEEPKRTAQAVGLVRAAVEAELSRGGDARVAILRSRTHDTVLIGREPDDPGATTTAADLLAYAVRLGKRANELAELDPLPTRQRAVAELRAIPEPEGMPALGDQRLLQLAAAASNDVAAVSAGGQLYPVGMPAGRALRLAIGALAGRQLSIEEVQDRVAKRFPRAERLPGRPDLGDLLRECEAPLTWDRTHNMYVRTPTRMALSLTHTAIQPTPLGGPTDATETEAKLREAIERHGFLAVLTPLRHLTAARRALLTRLSLSEVDVTAILLDRLRAAGLPWELIVAADTGVPTDVDFRSLNDLVAHDVVPAIEQALATPAPLLITEAAPLARYGQLRLIAELADQTRPRPAARLLLVPARHLEPAMLDHAQLPLTSPRTQSMWLRSSWIERQKVDT